VTWRQKFPWNTQIKNWEFGGKGRHEPFHKRRREEYPAGIRKAKQEKKKGKTARKREDLPKGSTNGTLGRRENRGGGR